MVTWLLRDRETGYSKRYFRMGDVLYNMELYFFYIMEQRSEHPASFALCQLPPTRGTGCFYKSDLWLKPTKAFSFS